MAENAKSQTPTSVNEQAAAKARNFKAFVPTLSELLLYLMVSLLTLVIVNSMPAIRANNKDSYVFLSTYIRDFVQRVIAPINNQGSSSWLTFLFWAMIGAATYVIVWLVGAVIYAFRNDIPPIRGFLMPSGLHAKAVWYSALGRVLVRLLALLAFIYWLYVVLVSIFPYASNLFLGNIADFNVMHALNMLLATITLALSGFVGIVFLRCVFLRDRILNR